MYSLKVRGTVQKEDKKSSASKEKADTLSSSSSSLSKHKPSSPETAGTATAQVQQGEDTTELGSNVDLLNFSAGNPRVEHITGIVHLYRHLLDDDDKQEDVGLVAAMTEKSPSATFSGLPPSRTEQLCILSLPPDMGFPELCTFLGAYFDRVKEIRLVRRDSAAKSTCLVLLRFDAQDAADGFYTDFNGKPFCMLEPEFVCRLLYVKEVEVSDSFNNKDSNDAPPVKTATFASVAAAAAGGAKPTTQQQQQQKITDTQKFSPPRPPPGVTELPSCPVCLERLDEHVSGIVTTVCNHKFHNQCLRQWGDTSCPVCRYCQHPTETTSHCASCGTSTDLWICLICGHVGCGRYRGSHAASHWQESGHGYALELESQRVWDYASDAYVHRLIRSKTDGKIVEVPAPGDYRDRNGSAGGGGGGNTTGRGDSCGGGGADCGECSNDQPHHRHHHGNSGSASDRYRGGECYSDYSGGDYGGGLDPELEEAMVLSKLDVLAQEYNHLLVSQLESQRHHYEGLLEKQQRELQGKFEEERDMGEVMKKAMEVAERVAMDAERKKQQLESKVVELSNQLDTSKKEAAFLKELNDTLLANQKEFTMKLNAADANAAEQSAMIIDLQEQVRDLMVFLDAQQTIARSGEVAGGTVLPLPAAPQRRGGKKKK
jgi:BRCA1-associated protein